jgi:hypothetical protein
MIFLNKNYSRSIDSAIVGRSLVLVETVILAKSSWND